MNVPNTREALTKECTGQRKSEGVERPQCQPLGFGTQIHGLCVSRKRELLNYGAIIPSRDPEDCTNRLSLQKLLPCVSVTCGLFCDPFTGCLCTVCLVKLETLDISLQFDLPFT